jgi:dynein assembly factor with WDR repeat domains 1
MRLKRFLLRYYPPGITLEYEQSSILKTKTIDLLQLKPDSDPDAVVRSVAAQEPLITPAREGQVKKLVLKLQQKLKQENEHRFYLFKAYIN